MKKKLKEIRPEFNPVSSTVSENVVLVPDEIKPLDLNVDLGRTDLNELVGKIQDKINELVKKVN